MKPKADTGFAGRLKALREAGGLTQQQLAELVGMNRFAVAKLEQGVAEPGWPTVVKLAEALGVDAGAFQTVPSAKTKPQGRGRPRKPAAEAKGKRKRG